MRCITSHWDLEDGKGVYSCPQCRQTITPIPALYKNTMLAEVVEQLKKTKRQVSVPAGPEDVECDVCTVVLEERKRKFHLRIQQRQKDLEKLREAVESHKHSAQTAVEDSERIFTELIRFTERSCSEVTKRIRDKEKAAVNRAEGLIYQLEQEIDELRRRDAELVQLSHTNDHIQFLQSFQSLAVSPESTETSITVSSLLSFDEVKKSVSQLKEKLQDFCREEIEKISGRATYIEIIPTNELKIREDFLQCKT
ncbi:hypothetical protein cypCar_00012865 [Cyprinus carpio]|nr:hypothetical protein cypCar_00012865 [Cyprinus carpio]